MAHNQFVLRNQTRLLRVFHDGDGRHFVINKNVEKIKKNVETHFY